ncbi:hypothetical protein CRENBAI_008716 [Crenichthys baileyi]|uniref:Uncharacterized protein n=1 Tax=Crenichthys baileyi TaxID=28760 RepID=A0AAV9RMF4_9TELE
MGEEVEVVQEYKYRGVHLDNRLEWRCNCEAIYKKGQSRLLTCRVESTGRTRGGIPIGKEQREKEKKNMQNKDKPLSVEITKNPW